MFGNSIGSRVNKVIKERTKVAQVKHDERVKTLEAEHQAEIERLATVREQAIEDSALKAVESVICKIN